MKLMHLSDLHLGKRLNDFSLLDDQKFILEQIISIADDQKPDCVLIAGDVYDKSVPSAEAVALFDSFISSLAARELSVFVISGNHDSAERIAFGAQVMKKSGMFFSPVYNGSIAPAVLHDAYGEVRFNMLPFIRPSGVREFFPDKTIDSYTAAVSAAVEAMQIDPAVRNVLIAHQFVTGASLGGSEEVYAGGLENVDASVFAEFDYTALGHIHGPQNVGSERIRYCGTPLKYSFSEVHHHKSVTIAELKEKGAPLHIETVPLTPKTDMQELRGCFAELMEREASEAYTRIILTDEEMIPDAIGRLRRRFPNTMMLDYDNERTRSAASWTAVQETAQQTPLELFSAFYAQLNGKPMNPGQQEIVQQLIREIWEGEQ